MGQRTWALSGWGLQGAVCMCMERPRLQYRRSVNSLNTLFTLSIEQICNLYMTFLLRE